MKLSRLIASLAAVSLVSVVPIQHADGQCRVNEAAKLAASDPAEGDPFGNSVAVSGDVAVVGTFLFDLEGLFPRIANHNSAPPSLKRRVSWSGTSLSADAKALLKEKDPARRIRPARRVRQLTTEHVVKRA